MLQCVAVCCSELQCDVVCCSDTSSEEVQDDSAEIWLTGVYIYVYICAAV